MGHRTPGRVRLMAHDQVWINRPSQRDGLTGRARLGWDQNHGIFHGNLDGKVSNLHETPAATIWNTLLCENKLQTTQTLPSLFCGRHIFTTLRSLRLLHPFPTHVLLLLHLHATPFR
jgi:hypothetical protein